MPSLLLGKSTILCSMSGNMVDEMPALKRTTPWRAPPYAWGPGRVRTGTEGEEPQVRHLRLQVGTLNEIY